MLANVTMRIGQHNLSEYTVDIINMSAEGIYGTYEVGHDREVSGTMVGSFPHNINGNQVGWSIKTINFKN